MEQKKMRPMAVGRTGEKTDIRGTGVKKAVRENPEISVILQESAVVVSAFYQAKIGREVFAEMLRQGLGGLAEEFETRGAVIGHIKASLDSQRTEMFSVTEREVYVKSSGEDELCIRLAAIVFMVDPQLAAALVREMFADLDRKIRK
ncbi:MAG TPA: hypothetical protein DF613_02495 [Lachnospiraceae bacterium]|nr:hypothetical protein [Lachnospiraceae bacterium]